MAKIEIIIAKLPVLIADRSDALKLETAIRYIGDIIFDASQNSHGEKAAGLAKVLSQPSSQAEAESREAILDLFRDGYLDRYAEYSALKDIAHAAGISTDPRTDPFNQNPTSLVDAPKVISLTKMLNKPPVSIHAAAHEPPPAQLVKPLKPRLPIQRKEEQTQRLESKEGRASNVSPQQADSGSKAADRIQNATSFLEITSLEVKDRNPIGFAKKFQRDRADDLSGRAAPCLTGFVARVSADKAVEWMNPVTNDSFRDYGDRLASGSTGRLAIRAMLELARADNWTMVSVKGNVRLQAFAEATAAELDRPSPVNPRTDISGGSSSISPPASPGFTKRRQLTYVASKSGLLLTLVLGFGAAYIYWSPAMQNQLGLTELIDNLPWKHQELVAKAREHPLDFQQLSLMLSTRLGSPLSRPKAAFTDTELANARYLKWDALFTNEMAGLGGRSDIIEARFYDPDNVQIASSDDQRFVGPNETATDFSGVALLPDTTNIIPGTYRVALYSDDQLLTQQRFAVSKDLAAAVAAAESKKDAAAEAAAAAETKHKSEAERLAMIQEKMRRPLQLKVIEFVNSTKDGSLISGPSDLFNVSKVLFVGWKAIFQNRLYGLGTNQYCVDAAYIGPDGSTVGSVDDSQTISQSASRAVFTGRVGNSAGRAFLLGQYTVNFYLNGQYFGQKRFTVVPNVATATIPGSKKEKETEANVAAISAPSSTPIGAAAAEAKPESSPIVLYRDNVPVLDTAPP